jgi:schlafen family protein
MSAIGLAKRLHRSLFQPPRADIYTGAQWLGIYQKDMDMWIPKSVTELEELIPQGIVEESATLDFKAELPHNSKELAKDVAAMANDGGVLVFGVGEDHHGQPTQLAPIALHGAAERITAIARSAISPAPELEIRTLTKSSENGIGYLVVIIPPSPVAPHMVTVGKENRFYGRTAKSNTPLSEAEIARLYERRKSWRVDREVLLGKLLESAPISPHPDLGFLHLFAQPAAGTDELLSRATQGEANSTLIQELIGEALNRSAFSRGFSPGFSYGRTCPISTGWVVYMAEPPSNERKPKYILDLEIHFDGSARLFCGRAAERLQDDLQVFDEGVAETTTRFLSLLGALYERSGYLGPVDLGVGITGIEGAVSYTARRRLDLLQDFVYREGSYTSTTRTSSGRLIEEPIDVAHDLLSRFFHAILGGNFDPLRRREIG